MSNFKKIRLTDENSLLLEPFTKDTVWLEVVDNENEMSNKPYGAVTLKTLKEIDVAIKNAIKSLSGGEK